MGLSPKTLADRLKELENASLIKRETFAEIPPRVEYSLTKGRSGIEKRHNAFDKMGFIEKCSDVIGFGTFPDIEFDDRRDVSFLFVFQFTCLYVRILLSRCCDISEIVNSL